MDLNIRLLRYFVALIDEGHLGRAAAKLLISTTALTQQIRKLERQVGFILVDPGSRPVAPTPEGAAFLPEARALLTAAGRAGAVAKSEARMAANRFALGFVGTPLGRFTRTVVEAFNRLAGPDVLQLVELELAEQTSAVAGGTVDASLAWGPVYAPELRVEHAISAPRVLMVPADHPLSGRESVRLSEIGEEAYVDLPHDTLGERWSRWWAVDPRPDGTPIRYTASARTIPELIEVVTSGRAVTIASSLIANSLARRAPAFVQICDIEPSEVVLCTRPRDASPRTALLRELVGNLDGRVTDLSGHCGKAH